MAVAPFSAGGASVFLSLIHIFSIYGKDVQDATDTSIPEDVAEKILRFCRAGLAVATLR